MAFTESILRRLATAVLAAGLLAGLLAGCASDGTGAKAPELAGMMASQVQAARDAESTHDYPSAAGYYAQLSNKDPDNVGFLLAASRTMRYAGRAKDAERRMLEMQPKHGSAHGFALELAKAQIAAGHADGALKTLDALIQLGQLGGESGQITWEAHSARGVALDSQERYAEAQQAYQAALAVSPSNPKVLNNLGMSQAQSGQLGQAISTLEKAYRMARSDSQIRQNLALVYGISGNMERARALSSMSLNEDEVDTNMSFFQRFRFGEQQ